MRQTELTRPCRSPRAGARLRRRARRRARTGSSRCRSSRTWPARSSRSRSSAAISRTRARARASRAAWALRAHASPSSSARRVVVGIVNGVFARRSGGGRRAAVAQRPREDAVDEGGGFVGRVALGEAHRFVDGDLGRRLAAAQLPESQAQDAALERRDARQRPGRRVGRELGVERGQAVDHPGDGALRELVGLVPLAPARGWRAACRPPRR